MNASDFDFSNPPKGSTLTASLGKAGRNETSRGARSSASGARQPTDNDGDTFLRIVEKTSRIACHRELYELLQSEDIQHFIPHQILISAWGDFGTSCLPRDVISALPGLRTGLLHHCTMDDILQPLYKHWLVQGRQPILLDSTKGAQLDYSDCNCTLHQFMQGKWSLLVHGVTNVRDGEVSLYLALHANSIVKGDAERFLQLVDPLITQIDVAFRRIAALKSPGLVAEHGTLSHREEELLMLVAEGKSNIETAQILAISPFTVKAHMQRIMKKLNANNRTEAVAKHRKLVERARRHSA